MEDKKYVKLLELDERDVFFSATFINDQSQIESWYPRLIGRIFELSKSDGASPWLGFSGWLVGDTLGDWDDGYYIFAYAKVEEVSKEALM